MKSKLFALLLLFSATPAAIGCGGGGVVTSVDGAQAHVSGHLLDVAREWRDNCLEWK